MIYLDNAATTLIKPVGVSEAVRRAMQTMASPGRGGHQAAMRAAELVLDCRLAAAELFHVPEPEQVVFTGNATHGLNIAIGSLAGPGSRVLISGFEHNAVTRPLHAIGARLSTAGRCSDPRQILEEFKREIPQAELVVCTHVSNVFGFVMPLEEIAALCRRQGVPLIVDASQSAGVLELDFERLGAAFVAMPGHKALLGPQGTGLLLCGEPGRPLLHGGSGSDSIPQRMPAYLPDRLEAGTHNVPGIAGLLAGLNYVRERGPESVRAHESALLGQMLDSLSDVSELELFTGQSGWQSGVLSLRSRRYDTETLASLLDREGVCVRGGLHCAPRAHETMGTLETGTVRFSFSPFTAEREVREACRILRGLHA